MIRNTLTKFVLLLAILLGTGMGVRLVAQDDDPFGGGATKAADPAPKGKARSSESARAKQPTVHPILEQLIESNPNTLDQLTRATRITMELSDLEWYKRYAEAWLALKPSDADLAALNRKYGSALFLEMARRRDLQPEGMKVADTVLTAAAKYTRDPDRLNDFITKLSAADEATQLAALRGLREAGREGIVALIHALADDTFKADRAAIRKALAKLGRDVADPLIAALSAPQHEVRADAATVLGELKARESAPYLVGLAAGSGDAVDAVAAREALKRFTKGTPTGPQAAEFIAQRIRALLAGEVPGKLDDQEQIGLWHWDDKANSVRLDHYPQDQASLVVAARFSRQLLDLAPQDPEMTRLALLVQLEADQTFAGLDNPLPQAGGTAWALAKSLGDDVVEAALVDAIALDRPTATAALVEVLGDSGRPELLTKYAGHEGPLAKALGYPDRRVQVAALKAILALDPVTSYPGASRVMETMKFLLSSNGQPRVLVGHPRKDEALRIATLYSELGYEADSATTGSALVRQAVTNADYELILVSETLEGLSDAVQALRKDSRTARVPIGVMSHYVVLEPRYLPDPLPEMGRQAFLRSVFSLNANRDDAVKAYQIAMQASRDSRLTVEDLTAGVPDTLVSSAKLGLRIEDVMAIAVQISSEMGKDTFAGINDLLFSMATHEQFHGQGLQGLKDLMAMNDAQRERVLGNSRNRKLAYQAIRDSFAEIETSSAKYDKFATESKSERWKLQIDESEFAGLTEITEEEKRLRRIDEERYSAKRLPGARAERAVEKVEKVEKVELATVVPAPHSPEALNYTHHQVMKLAPTRAVAPDLRLEQAHYVLVQLTDLLGRETPPKFYDYSRLEQAAETASRSPTLAPQAFQVLSLLGTPNAQLALVEQASIASASLEERQAAAKALHKAILRRGVFLTQTQIQKQYDLFATSNDTKSKAVLQQVLDAIEEPSAAERAEKIKLLPKKNGESKR